MFCVILTINSIYCPQQQQQQQQQQQLCNGDFFFCLVRSKFLDKVTGEWRKLHYEELSDLYSLLNIVRVVKSRRMRWAGHVARMGQGRGVHRVLVGKPEGKRPLGRPRRRWGDNIKMDLQEVGGGCKDWMELAQDRVRWRALVSMVMNLGFQKCGEFLD